MRQAKKSKCWSKRLGGIAWCRGALHVLILSSAVYVISGGVPESTAKVTELNGELASGLSLTRWGSRVDAWVVGSNGDVWHRACFGNCDEAGQWTAWESAAGKPPGGIDGTLTAVAPVHGRIDIFARSGTSLMHQTWMNGGWQGWQNLGCCLNGSPAAVSPAPGRIDVYARGTDGRLWHRACRSGTCRGVGWTDWDPNANRPAVGLSASRPAVISWAAPRMDIFVRGGDNAVWHRLWTGTTYLPWASTGGNVQSGIGAATWGPERVDLFAVGFDQGLWARTYDTQWRGWRHLGIRARNAPGAVATARGRVHIAFRGTTNRLHHIVCNGNDNCEAAPDPVAHPGPNRVAEPNRLDIFYRSGNSLQLVRCNGTVCNGATGHHPVSLGPSINSGIAITREGARLDVFARGSDGRIWHRACLYGCGSAAN